MKLIMQFIKPHWKLCAVTILLLIVDVTGALVIAHRLSTIRDADMILFMEHGNILEQGSPSEPVLQFFW